MLAIDVYARVSRAGDQDQRSTTGQAQVCGTVLRERGLPLGETHVDDGRSAWNPRVRRPGWDALMARLEGGASGGVIVYDLERFSRRPPDGERLITAAERGLLVLDSESEYDLTSPNGKKQFRDAMAAAAWYSDNLQRKVKRGKQMKAAQGKVDRRRSFGFEQDGITIKESEAKVIRECAERLLSGDTQDALIRELQERGVATVRGARWGYTTFRQIMTRPRNAGYIVHNGEPVSRLPGKPILDQDTHDRITALYASRRPGRQPSGRYLLTGIAVCRCGTRMKGRPVTGTPRRQYWCPGCAHTFADCGPLDSWVADWTIRELADPDRASALEEAERHIAEQRERLSREIASIEATLLELAERLGQGWSLARHDRAAVPLEARLVELRSKAASRELEALPAVRGRFGWVAADGRLIHGPGSRAELLLAWEEGTTAEQRAMVTRALAGRRMVIGPGRPARFDPKRVEISTVSGHLQ